MSDKNHSKKVGEFISGELVALGDKNDGERLCYDENDGTIYLTASGAAAVIRLSDIPELMVLIDNVRVYEALKAGRNDG